MRVWTHDRFTFPLPERHRFPLGKYTLLRERLEAEGLVSEVLEAPPATWEALGRVQDADLLQRIRTGTLGEREARGLGIPWSGALVERGRRSSWATVLVAREALRARVAMNLGGGTHHAGRAFARGYCLFNDVALAVAELRRGGEAQRVVVVDCDVHQGDGTADLLGPDPDAFTLSIHGARNYPFKRVPSDLDVDLPTGTADAGYLVALEDALATALAAGPFDLAFFLAGADPWEGDRLGRLSLTKGGLRRRDALVLDILRGAGLPVCVVLAGGYAPNVEDTVDINVATAVEVAARVVEPAGIEPATSALQRQRSAS